MPNNILFYFLQPVCTHACFSALVSCLDCLKVHCQLQSKQSVHDACKADIAPDLQDHESFSMHVGNGCANGQTCLSLDDGEVCSPNSKSACQCYDEELPEGSRCDLYGKQLSCTLRLMHMFVDAQTHITLGVFQWTVQIAPRHMRDHYVCKI